MRRNDPNKDGIDDFAESIVWLRGEITAKKRRMYSYRTEKSQDAPGWPVPIRTRVTLDVVSLLVFVVSDYIRKTTRL